MSTPFEGGAATPQEVPSPPPPVNPQIPVKKPRNTLGLVALILAIAGTILSCVPGIIILGWILLPASFVLGLVAVLQKDKAHGQGLAAIIISIVGTIVAAIAFIAVIDHAVDQALTTETTTSTPAASSPQSTPAESNAPATNEGDAGSSRENPLPIGSEITTKDWKVTVNSVDLNADEKVAAASDFNEPATDGFSYVLINITATYLGHDSQGQMPWATVDFVSKDGKTYNLASSQKLTVAPEEFDQLSPLFNGASTTGNIVIEVPTDGIEQGTLAVQAELLADKKFFAVK